MADPLPWDRSSLNLSDRSPPLIIADLARQAQEDKQCPLKAREVFRFEHTDAFSQFLAWHSGDFVNHDA